MTYGQGKLFPQAERLKLRQARVKKIDRNYWTRLWKKGWDPAYILEVEPDDIPTFAEVWRKADGMDTTVMTTPKPENPGFHVRRLKAIVLSKGPEDLNRRIVAQGDGSWLFGLFVALLQRQVRDGTMATQGKCYATITNLECDEMRQALIDNWTQELLTKRQI